VKRAQIEIDSLFRGQWENGMIPHMIFGDGDQYIGTLWPRDDKGLMPQNQRTSGITQPPLLAEAMVHIGQKLSKKDRKAWYKHHFNQLLGYHEWLYRERDPKNTGLVALVHPWESGIDNSPAWMKTVHGAGKPTWIQIGQTLGMTNFLKNKRKDTHYVPASERIDTVDALLLFHQQTKLTKVKYDSAKLLKSSKIATKDVLFNSILIRGNQHILDIADEIGAEVPNWLKVRMNKAKKALDSLWNEKDKCYYDHKYKNNTLVHEPSIGRYLPLYSGALSRKRANVLVRQLKNEMDEVLYPIPTVPLSSKYFDHHRYWQGPSWVNTNWLIIDGLERNGYKELADLIRTKTIELVAIHGPYEYFSPTDGTPAGAHQFSWTAALTLDLVKTI
jgi:hypothetical protein